MKNLTRRGVLVVCLAGVSCGGPPARVDGVSALSGAPQEPTRGEEDAEATLEGALDEVWELQMRHFPTWATYEGDRRFDDRLTDLTPQAEVELLTALEATAARVEAIAPDRLSPMSRDTRALLLDSVRQRRARRICHFEWWSVDGLSGPQVDWPMLPVFHSIRDAGDLANLTARYRATGPQMGQRIANLREGLSNGYAPARINVERALDQVSELLTTPVEDDPLLLIQPVDEGVVYDLAELQAAVETVVRPALSRYAEVLRGEVLPVARDRVGVGALPDGAACYRVLVRGHIGEGYEPEALHAIGLELLEWTAAGMLETAREAGLAVDTAAAAMAAMEGTPSQFADDADELLRRNREAVERAWTALPRAFGRLPRTPIEVRPMEAHRAPDAPAAYYYSAPEDGSRPAYYYVNLYEPATRPLYNLEPLAYHEAVPGHHLQIALALELPDVHIWRRSAGQTAFVEGWALYAEVLADELGLYSSPSARFGMYNYQAWRAARLVVDTGLHLMGWSRGQALDFLLANTALTVGEAANEIDRYIAWPGQALAYMVGRLAIEALRAEAEAALGDSFDLATFHDELLGAGAVTLDIMRANMSRWLRDETAAAAARSVEN